MNDNTGKNNDYREQKAVAVAAAPEFNFDNEDNGE